MNAERDCFAGHTPRVDMTTMSVSKICCNGVGMCTIRGIVFDKDGTMTDFHRTWLPAYQEAAQWLARFTGRPSLALRLLVASGYGPQYDRFDTTGVLSCASSGQPAVEADDCNASGSAAVSRRSWLPAPESLRKVPMLTPAREARDDLPLAYAV